MKKLQMKTKGTTATLSHWHFKHEIDPETLEPDKLRNWVQKALCHLGGDEWIHVRDRLLVALRQAGFNVGQCLLMLGIPARTADELTAPEIATLIRYVRINEPKAMRILVPILGELVTREAEPARVHGASHAA